MAKGKVTSVVSRSFEHHTGKRMILARLHPNFEEEHPGVVRGLLTSLSFPPTSRKDLWLNGYLKYPMTLRHYTLTNIHVSPRFKLQTQRHSSQRR
ncbi:hypothetical protein TNCV_2126351 [Trichonephila clavipes]|nr:hypothetical protein TNCV_2126351 [Trichonephila clavipes]